MKAGGLEEFVKILEAHGELVRVKEFVDPVLEITEVADRMIKEGRPALLFENTGTGFPLLINALGSEKRICLALSINHLDEISERIEDLFKTLATPKAGIIEKMKMLPTLGKLASWMPKTLNRRGACQEVVMDHVDLNKLPVMTCWPEDGGPFMTLPVINTFDPIEKIRNVGLYRMQIFSENLTGMHWHRHKVSASHFKKYQELGQRMPVAVAFGGDPVYTYSATAPMPPNVDEYLLAGFIRQKKVELVKCLTQDIYVPEDADIIVEGYVDPSDELIYEGPFGDHTGYYSLADYYPKFHVTCITHRKNAIYPSTIVGIPPQEDAWIGKATERIFLAPIKMTMLPEIVDMGLPVEGVFHNLTMVSVKKEYPGHANKVMNAMWGAGQMMFNKMLVINSDDVDIHDYLAVARAITQNTDPLEDTYTSKGPMDVLDHACSKFGFGGKLCIDATAKMDEEKDADTKVYECPKSSSVDSKDLLNSFPEMKAVSTQLLDLGISVLVVSIEKNAKGQVEKLGNALFARKELKNIKFLLVCEEVVDVDDVKDVIWRITNNVDPVRDCYTIREHEEGVNHLIFDGTRKTLEHDDFKREWPNIIAMDEKTMDSVDAKWEKLGIGEFIESPSRKYRKQLYPGGAVAE